MLCQSHRQLPRIIWIELESMSLLQVQSLNQYVRGPSQDHEAVNGNTVGNLSTDSSLQEGNAFHHHDSSQEVTDQPDLVAAVR